MKCQIVIEIPLKIKEEIEKNPENKWIEKYDRLKSNSEFIILENENQYKHWKSNCAIRRAFSEIEKDIQLKLANGLKVSVREVGWSEIARKAKCDRNTLKHPKRLWWVNEYRDKLLNILKTPIEPNTLKVVKTLEEAAKLEIEKIKLDLKKCENETSKWFLKFHDALDKINKLEKVIETQRKEITMKNEEIIKLQQQLKRMMKN